jgi:hypothetical protein
MTASKSRPVRYNVTRCLFHVKIILRRHFFWACADSHIRTRRRALLNQPMTIPLTARAFPMTDGHGCPMAQLAS